MERLDTIKLQDALLDGEQETVWPEADFIVGNPPFLGDKKMRRELGDDYVEQLRKLFKDRVPGQADFVCYWFEKARAQIAEGRAKRTGLISTNSISGGASRKVLERIKETGDIFTAWDDQPWILDGAAVRVSIVGFDDGSETSRTLDGQPVAAINPDLTSETDLSQANRLLANVGIAYQGTIKMGNFNLPYKVVEPWLDSPNPTGESNRDVLRPWINGMDITRLPSNTWVIDFAMMTKEQAQHYVIPFSYVEENIMPERIKNRDKHASELW